MYRDIELVGLELFSPRLTLRPWRPADAGVVEQVLRAPEMRTWFALPDPYTAADAREFVEHRGQVEREHGTGLACAIVESDSGRLVGSIELRLRAPGRPWPDIGYWIAPAAQGRGYAAEATRLLTDWAFACEVARLELRMDVRNAASILTALAAGYRFDGVQRAVLGLPDGRYDLATFGRLATDTGEPIRPALPRLPAAGLSDGIIALRVLDPVDVPALVEMENDPLTIATGFTGVATSVGDLERAAARASLDWLVGLGAHFSVLDAVTGELAGSVRVRMSGPPNIGGLGYAVHPRFRGRGYTARALRLLASWAFAEAGFARLELGAKTSNVASQRAALGGGFVPDGTMTARLRNPDGTFSDEARFALVNPAHRPS